MRCPKCHYISFDNGDRCRNCGYEFSLSVDVKTADDLPIQTGDEPLGPLEDFSLADRDHAPARVGRGESGSRAAGVAGGPTETPAAVPSRNTDLPLFRDRGLNADAPLVTPPAVPRAPLAVRRASPVIPRPPSKRPAEEPRLELGPQDTPEPAALEPIAIETGDASGAASLGRRALGGAIDALILGTIDLGVLYFTLRLCGLDPVELTIIPPVPFFSFLLILNGGYFVAFTAASGQTIGKMAAGTRVVPADEGDGAAPGRVPFGSAVVRAASYLVSIAPAGLGMLPAFFSADARALHDRLAGTRVIRA